MQAAGAEPPGSGIHAPADNVITSYSIHYTKLYEDPESAAPSARAGSPDGGRGTVRGRHRTEYHLPAGGSAGAVRREWDVLFRVVTVILGCFAAGAVVMALGSLGASAELRRQRWLKFLSRITSYNVCYTKLLRC